MLEENDYIRTDLGEIAIVTSVAKETLQDIVGEVEGLDRQIGFCNTEPYVRGNIVKHSKNIIDLIEVGDFINGMKIDDIGEIKRFGKTAQKCLWVNIGDGIDIIDEEIKDILTKEQHMQNCYKIAEENSSIN